MQVRAENEMKNEPQLLTQAPQALARDLYQPSTHVRA